MAELTGNPGFAPPRKENALSKRRAANIAASRTGAALPSPTTVSRFFISRSLFPFDPFGTGVG